MDNITKSVISDLEAIATNMTGDLTPANVANIALAKLTSDQQPAAAQADDGQGIAVAIPEFFDIDAFQHAIINMDGDLIMGRIIAESRVRDAAKAHDEIVTDLKAEIASLRSQVTTLTAERDAEKQRGDNNHKMLMNSIRNKQS